MLQINPNEVIRISKLIDNSLDTINSDIQYFKKKYINNPDELEKLDIDNLTKSQFNMRNTEMKYNFFIDIYITPIPAEYIEKGEK